MKKTLNRKPTTLPKRPSIFNWRTLWGLLFLASFVWSLHSAGVFERDLINEGGWNLVWRFLVAAVHPDFSPEFLQLTLDATFKTLAYAVCGTFFSVLIGLVAGILSSEVWWESVLKTQKRKLITQSPWLVVRGVLAIPRAIHELIWGLFFVNIFGLDPLVAVLAIAIPFGAITAKVFSEILDETPRQPLMALLNSGVPPLNAFIYSLILQAFLNLLSYAFYRFECSIRSAAVLGIIGAGGLGYQIFLSLQSLRYEQMWTFLIALILLTGATDFWSAMLRRRLGAPSRLDLNVLNLSGRKKPLYQNDPVVKVSFLGTVVLAIFSFWYVQADYSKLYSPRTFQLLAGVFQDALPPDFSQLSQLFELSAKTLAMSILAMAGAGLGGIFLSFPAANNFLLSGARGELRGNVVLFVTRFLLLVARAVPEPIWALIFLFVLFPGILPGAIALSLHNLGILGRLMAEVVENLEQRPITSLKALGATDSQVFLYGILPRTLPRFVAYILYRWEVCIRSTVIVGLVGAGGLGRLLAEQLSSFDYKGLLTTLIVFLVLTFSVDLISASVRRFLR
ncbi:MULTISPECIES: PhnE/PtxC family ABC transporter permease [Cyanophyceae]|uniref:PhnE/PtxC family ABC transporter permease n=1 Tax=Cyanophyceae TaxID=3028117 RepID=UPI0016843E88|nr:ABC transporter permease subunit [Trichocoleus sp. FACHB-40]MBD2004690.1 ABC transporter permease subunit [Trichocoleus sp. FACHB-40]